MMNGALSGVKSALLRLTGDSRGQVLPLTLVALAMGALLVSPFLVNASANLLAGRSIDLVVKETYSADAGIEWGLWHLKNNPVLTTSTPYTSAPLQTPPPPAINGATFPTTEIRYVQGAGMSDSIAPTWQEGSVPKCYPFQSTDVGSIFATVTFDGGQISIDLLAGWGTCPSTGSAPMGGVSPYVAQFPNEPAGKYQLVVKTSLAGTGTVVINYPVATYDIRSQANPPNGRMTTVRATASYDASHDAVVRVFSWQLN